MTTDERVDDAAGFSLNVFACFEIAAPSVGGDARGGMRGLGRDPSDPLARRPRGGRGGHSESDLRAKRPGLQAGKSCICTVCSGIKGKDGRRSMPAVLSDTVSVLDYSSNVEWFLRFQRLPLFFFLLSKILPMDPHRLKYIAMRGTNVDLLD